MAGAPALSIQNCVLLRSGASTILRCENPPKPQPSEPPKARTPRGPRVHPPTFRTSEVPSETPLRGPLLHPICTFRSPSAVRAGARRLSAQPPFGKTEHFCTPTSTFRTSLGVRVSSPRSPLHEKANTHVHSLQSGLQNPLRFPLRHPLPAPLPALQPAPSGHIWSSVGACEPPLCETLARNRNLHVPDRPRAPGGSCARAPATAPNVERSSAHVLRPLLL